SDRASALHPARAHARERCGAGLPREPRSPRVPAAEGRGSGGGTRENRAVDGTRCAGPRMTSASRTKGAHHDFLVQIGCEELPPRALVRWQQPFVGGLGAGLAKASLSHGERAGFATPRRLGVLVKRLAAHQPEQHVKRRGPPVSAAFDGQGAPTRAALAFAESCGTRVEALERLDEGKGTFLYFVGTRAGEPALQLLPQLVQASLDQLPIPRRMHWGDGQAMFVRPVHWVVMLLGRDVVPATLLETPAGRYTQGHRFHAPKPLSLASPGAYEKTLRERGFVLADFAVRRERILTEV